MVSFWRVWSNPSFSDSKLVSAVVVVIAGAVASLGVALIPTYLIERELKSGQLVRLCEPTVTTKNSYYLVTPSNRHNPEVKLLCDWMKASVGKSIL